MKIRLITIGRTEEACVEEGLQTYEKRILHYLPYVRIELAANRINVKNDEKAVLLGEAALLEKNLDPESFVVLLDEKGKKFTSIEFAQFIQQKMNSGIKNLTFIIGGAYGFHERIYQIADEKISLSSMTFPHQLVRLIFAEQLYRALTILNHEPYHHS
ncbi:MAG: Ribosomal RNA large subunit methyltransferase H [Bacteroidetes bacterium 38_7]|nr:MAG: Ribosomal RNA large subunit methyltransferase H [Bacteroidetes bacterium 38_7]HAL64221.1 23S rRNA (pseudouridine(1915)-N(3))-methyltransferase RlmH [Bacteroidales bacterium]